MTNREWLESLSDEKLAEIFGNATPCKACPVERECRDFINCCNLWQIWLKAERDKK